MKLPPLKALIWPESPAGFDQNGLALVLLALAAGTRRADARSQARGVLRELAGRLLPGVPVELVETPRGPQFPGSGIRISLSYAGDKVLIGLSKEHELGVDIVQIDNIPESEALSGLYLPNSASAPRRDEDFALRWAEVEACCKALGLPLAEMDQEREKAYATCDLLDCEQIAGYRMSAAIHP